MRLIDADVLLDICKNKYSDIVAGSYPFNVVVYDLVNIIESQPLAYDVKKVVAELEEERERNLNGWKDATNIFALTKYGHVFSAYVKAIDIVKSGGTDLGYNPYQE